MSSMLSALQELSVMNTLAQELVDAWRVQHAHVADVFTVWDERTNARASNKGLRVDYTLCSPDLHSKVSDCQVKLDIPQVRPQRLWGKHHALRPVVGLLLRLRR